MTGTKLTPELIEQGYGLIPSDRQRFANLLLESLEETPMCDGVPGKEYTEAELSEELTRRWEEYERGEVRTYSHEEVMEKLRGQCIGPIK